MHIQNLKYVWCCISSFPLPGWTVGVCPQCVKVAAWVVMRHTVLIVFLWCRNRRRPFVARISLRSSVFDDVSLWHAAHSFSPQLCLCCTLLNGFLPFSRCHLFIWMPVVPATLSLSACHSLLHMITFLLAKPAYCFMWTDAFAGVYHQKPRSVLWRQRASARNNRENRFLNIA